MGRDRRSGEQSREGRGRSRGRRRRGKKREKSKEEEEEGRRDCLPDCLMLTVQPEKGLSILQSVHASLSAYRLQVTYRYTFFRSKVPMPTSLALSS